MITVEIPRSGSVQEASGRLLDAAGAWIGDCVARYGDEPATNVHDQGTYTISWLPVLQARPDAAVTAFLKRARDRMHAHYATADLWRHGYWRKQEVHHGTEHFELFLATLWRLAPEDGETIAAFADMAEHLGNWSADVAPWFDWETGLYRSMYFGSDGLRGDEGAGANVADFFRCVNLALLAHQMTGEARYLELATRHGGLWADAILGDAAGRLPAALTVAGPVYGLDDGMRANYGAFAGMAPDLDTSVGHAENLMASDAINSLLTLDRLTGDARYRRAAAALVRELCRELGDPDAGAAASAVRDYRTATGDTQFDAAVLAATAGQTARQTRTLSMEPKVSRDRRPPGVGKRTDMPVWFEDRQARRHNPTTLAVAAEIAGDEDLAATALDHAWAYLHLARAAFPDGRQHGCSARSVSAVARGHGRDNNVGVLTGVLGPLLAWQRGA